MSYFIAANYRLTFWFDKDGLFLKDFLLGRIFLSYNLDMLYCLFYSIFLETIF
jgi:hypothetical protein